MEGKASVFIEDEIFINLHGIVAHPDGYLILGTYSNRLLKISLQEPEVIEIELADDIPWFEIADGMILHPDGSLTMVTFPASVIYRLDSDDNWASARLVAASEGHHQGCGTKVALRGKSVYVIYSHVDRFVNELAQPTFEIVRVAFEQD
jgi:hypothetical protein